MKMTLKGGGGPGKRSIGRPSKNGRSAGRQKYDKGNLEGRRGPLFMKP
jgi:hypothetical protein